MINAQLVKPISFFIWLPGLSGHPAALLCPADLHGDTRTLQSQHGRSCSAVEAQPPDQGLNRRPRAAGQALNHKATRKSPASHFWGLFFSFIFWLCWASTAAHGSSPAGLSGRSSAVAELGLSRSFSYCGARAPGHRQPHVFQIRPCRCGVLVICPL